MTGHDDHPILTTPLPMMGTWSGSVPIMTTTVDQRKHRESASLPMMTTGTGHTHQRSDHQRKHQPTTIPAAILPIMTTHPPTLTHSHTWRKP